MSSWEGVFTMAHPPEDVCENSLPGLAWTSGAVADRLSKVRINAYRFAKRTFDICAALVLLIAIWPVMLAIASAIKLDSKGPVFFQHARIGQDGKGLMLYKFRSMFDGAQSAEALFTAEQKAEWEENFKLKDDPRVTRVGRILRKSSLDELPQIFNILRGELSFVGPRPVVADELEKYGPARARFLRVKPGLTGYWQVNGRSAISYEERIALELYYADHASIWLDLAIIGKTFAVVLQKSGAV